LTVFSRVLVAIDGHPEGQRALDHAIALAATLDAELRAVVVEGRLPAYGATVGEVEATKRKKDEFFGTVARLAQEQAAEAGLDLAVELAAGAPAAAILRAAERDRDDLIVVGFHRRLLGSTADSLCHRAPCPVLVVRGDRPSPTLEEVS